MLYTAFYTVLNSKTAVPYRPFIVLRDHYGSVTYRTVKDKLNTYTVKETVEQRVLYNLLIMCLNHAQTRVFKNELQIYFVSCTSH